MPTHPPPDNVRCQPRSASTSSANDVAGIDLGTWSRNHALSSLRNASSAGVNDRSTLRNCPPNAGAVNSYRDVALGRSPPVSDHADDDAGVRRGLLRPRDWFVVVSTQDDHLHLLVEAKDRVRLSRGIAGLAIRIARAVNRALGRRGAVWSGRYHARAITTPRAVRHAIVYILFNRRSSPGALAETVLPDLLLQRAHRDPEPPRGLGAVLPVTPQTLDDQT